VGCNLSPALVAVGYIIQIKIAFLMLLGGILNWWIAIPLYSYLNQGEDGPVIMGVDSLDTSKSPTVLAATIWATQTRYIGVGAMLLGGLGAVVSLGRPLVRGIQNAFQAYKVVQKYGLNAIARTERDIPIPFILISIAVLAIPIAVIYSFATHNIGTGIAMTVFMLFAGFLFSAVGAYMSGIVGSSNNPISGVTLAAMIVASGMLLLFLGSRNPLGPPAAILIGAVVCCAAAIAGDNLQDMKAGAIVGSTPLVLQVMQLIGIIVPALVLSPTVGLLIQAYGLGDPDSTHPNPLPAPQASLMRAVTYSIFFGNIPYIMVAIGGGVAAVIMFIDLVASHSKQGLRIPVLSVALGLYLPLTLSVPIFLGGLVAWASSQTLMRLQGTDRIRKLNENNGLLCAAGMITGEALIGIIIAIPIVIYKRSDVMAIFGQHRIQWPGIICIVLVMATLYLTVIRNRILELKSQDSSVQTK